VRAVGGALSRNPVPIIVPCHRVVAKRWSGRVLLRIGFEDQTFGA